MGSDEEVDWIGITAPVEEVEADAALVRVVASASRSAVASDGAGRSTKRMRFAGLVWKLGL